MALWSKTDTQASKPKFLTKKVVIDATSTSVVNTDAETIEIRGHSYVTGDALIYTVTADETEIGGLTSGTTYYAIRVDSDTIKLATTAQNAAAGTAINLSAVGTGTEDTLQLLRSDVFFVDEAEAQQAENKARGITGAGWWTYTTYTDSGSVTRHKAECIVAMSVPSATSGDANDDTTVVDRTITIVSQPVNTIVTEGGNAVYTVEVLVSPTATATYQWQLSTDDGETFANISGATSATYTLASVAESDEGKLFRVVVSAAGATSVTSDEAGLIVNPAPNP